MARKFLTALDLAQNELQNARVHNVPGTTGPPTPVKGQLYFDSTGNVLYWWNGTVWVAAQGGAGVAYGTITQEQTFGATKTDGVSTNVARADHAHGNPTHVNADHAAINLSALAQPTADVSMGGFKITSLGAPVSGNDATNKTYVDNLVAGLSWKDSVRLATTGPTSASGLTAIDGVTPIAGDRILLKNSLAPETCGIYVAAAGAWTRATDADTASELNGLAVFVEQGTANADTAWVNTANITTINTDAPVFVQFAGGGAVTAGAGMTQSGNVLNVIGDASITVAADAISRAALTGDVTAAAGANGTTIANDAVTTIKILNDNVTNAKLADMGAMTVKANLAGSPANPTDEPIGSFIATAGGMRRVTGSTAAALTTTVLHNLNSRSVLVEVYRAATPWDTIDCDIERPDANNITTRFAVAPAAGEYAIVVIG